MHTAWTVCWNRVAKTSWIRKAPAHPFAFIINLNEAARRGSLLELSCEIAVSGEAQPRGPPFTGISGPAAPLVSGRPVGCGTRVSSLSLEEAQGHSMDSLSHLVRHSPAHSGDRSCKPPVMHCGRLKLINERPILFRLRFFFLINANASETLML